MIGTRVCALLLLGASAVVAGCSHDTDGELVTPTAVAGLRYVNLVPDTIGLDFRVIDIVGDAPNTFNATFRTGGQPHGVAITGLPPHTAVLAGTRQIRVFLSSSDVNVASQILLDQSFTFDANQNYTLYLWGYANGANGTPGLAALMVNDAVPTLTATQVALRVINLAPTFDGANPAPASLTAPADVFIRRADSATTSQAATVVGLGAGSVSTYAVVDTGFARIALAGTGSTTPFLAVPFPAGAAATPTSNPVAGTRVGGSALTAVIVPRSVPTTGAPQGGTVPTLRTPEALTQAGNLVTVRNGTRTVLENRTTGADSTTATTGAQVANTAVGDVIFVTGATEPEYNGWQQTASLAADTLISCTPTDPADTFNSCAAANVSALYHTGRFRYRVTGNPVSPATGAPTFRSYTATTSGTIQTGPAVLFTIDQRPPRTLP